MQWLSRRWNAEVGREDGGGRPVGCLLPPPPSFTPSPCFCFPAGPSSLPMRLRSALPFPQCVFLASCLPLPPMRLPPLFASSCVSPLLAPLPPCVSPPPLDPRCVFLHHPPPATLSPPRTSGDNISLVVTSWFCGLPQIPPPRPLLPTPSLSRFSFPFPFPFSFCVLFAFRYTSGLLVVFCLGFLFLFLFFAVGRSRGAGIMCCLFLSFHCGSDIRLFFKLFFSFLFVPRVSSSPSVSSVSFLLSVFLRRFF